MTINPLLARTSAGLSPKGATTVRSSTTQAFDTLLKSLQGSEQALPVRGQQAAAELLRIEMMQSSLSLSGSGEAAKSSGQEALEALLTGLAANRGKGGAMKIPAVRQPVAEAVPPVETIVTASGASAAAPTKLDAIGETAAHFIGTPYRFGGEGPNGIDCSSFVQQVFRENRIELPRTAREQSAVGSEVAQGDLRKGDLVFFQTYASYPSHFGICLGDGKMIHASSGKGEVTISDMNSDYYRSHFVGAKRVA
jgi:cell wall-associated NlpC family hydrolase